jgi:hypothetical protein
VLINQPHHWSGFRRSASRTPRSLVLVNQARYLAPSYKT